MLLGLAGFGLVVAVFYAEEDWRGWHAWHKFKQEWEAKGERFDFASAVPRTVPDDQNFALSPVWIAELQHVWQNNPKQAKTWYGDRVDGAEVSQFASLVPVGVQGWDGASQGANQSPKLPDMTAGRWATGRFTDLNLWASYYRDLAHSTPAAAIPITPRPESAAADVLLALGKYDPVLDKLRQDAALPDSRFPVIYNTDTPYDIMLPHLAMVKRYAQMLQLRAVAELQNGQGEKALADVKLLLRLTGSVRTEPFLISHLVRIAMINLAIQPVWEGVAEHHWSEAQLTELDSAFARLDFLADYKFSLRSELGAQGAIFDFLKRHPAMTLDILDDGNRAKTTVTKRLLWWLSPRGWYDLNHLSCARPILALYLPLADTNSRIVSPTAARKAEAAIHAEIKHPTRSNLAEGPFVSSLGNLARKFAYGQESVDLTRVAIALERSHLANGEYPELLGALEPRYIDKLPADVINGQPLLYRRSLEGKFTLYSVGWNETDDDGRVSSNKEGVVDNTKGDWVWKN